jgi:hypothetical protein
LYATCLIIVIYLSKGVDGCISFTTLLKPLKNGGHQMFLLFNQSTRNKDFYKYQISKFDAKKIIIKFMMASNMCILKN